jgi:hypothetical protein
LTGSPISGSLDLTAETGDILEKTAELPEDVAEHTAAAKDVEADHTIAELSMVGFVKCGPRSQDEEMAVMVDNFDERHDASHVLKDVPEASSNQQRILGSMMLQEEDDSKLAKKFAAKSAANPLGSEDIKVTSKIKPAVECELTDTRVMRGNETSKVDTAAAKDVDGQLEQWPPPTGRRGCQPMKSPRQSLPTRSPHLPDQSRR